MEEEGDPNMEEGRMISLCGREETINQAGSGTLHHDCDQEREEDNFLPFMGTPSYTIVSDF